MKKIILMLSIGDRPWAKSSFETFQRYADRYGADAKLITEDTYQDQLDLGTFELKRGRDNKRAYALKSFLPWLYMENGYDRVVMVDDSCSVHPFARSIFEEVPKGHIGWTGTSTKHARISFQEIAEFQEKKGEELIYFDEKKYANSGVVLYDIESKDAFSPDNIVAAKHLLYNRFPHQTLLYYLAVKGNAKIYRMPKEFNSMPAVFLDRAERNTMTSAKKYLDFQKQSITHFSGIYRSRNLLIEETSSYFLDLWREAGYG